MTAKRYRLMLMLMVAAAVLAALWLAGQRVQLENGFRQVELAVIYDEIRLLSELSGRDPGAVMVELRNQGVTAVWFKEENLRQAEWSDGFVILRGHELRRESWYAGAGFEQQPGQAYLLTRNERVFTQLQRQLEMKLGTVRTYLPDDGTYVIAVPASWVTGNIGVGFPARGIEQAASAGLNVIPQVQTWLGVTPAGLALLAEILGELPNVSAVAFNDPSVPGFPGLVGVLARELEPLGVPVTTIEFFDQAGVRQLGRLLPQRQVLVHLIRDDEMHPVPRYTPTQAAERFALAAAERNARILLVRLFLNPQGEEDVWAVNNAYLSDIAGRLAAAGLMPGTPAAPLPWQPPRGLIALIGLGVIAGGLLLWEKVRPGLPALLPVGLAVSVWLALVLLGDLNQGAKLMALAGVIIFPTLAVVAVVRERGSSVSRSVLRFLQATGISLVGAVLMVGLLSDTGFMIKLDQFAGVKLAHAVPLLLVLFYFAFRPRDGSGWLVGLRSFLEQPVMVKFAAAAVAAAVIATIYVTRTGNEPVMLVGSWELKLRAALDQALVVRPRFKEFLLGHPWLVLLLFTGYRDARYLPLVALGVIGQISLVNTFAHLHTPLLVSVFRAFNGLWLGIAFGLALIAVWWLAERRLQLFSAPQGEGLEKVTGKGDNGVEGGKGR